METLKRQVGRARRRMLFSAFLGRLAWCWFAALLVAAAMIAGGKWWAPPVEQRDWAAISIAAALALGFLAAGVWSWLRRESELAAAVEIDRRYGLKERVSSTLALDEQTRESEIGQALVRDAGARLSRIDVAEQFRLRLDRRALLPLCAAAVAFALAAITPLRAQAPAKAVTKAEQQTKQATQALVKRLSEKRKEAVAKGLQEADAIAKLEAGVKELAKKEQTDRKQTLMALNDLVKTAQERRDELAKAGDLKKQLAGMKNLEQGPAEKLAQALKNGDFERAVKEIEKLKEQLAGEKLEPEAQQALARQLDALRKELAEKADAHKRLEQELKEQLAAERKAGNQQQAAKIAEQLERLAEQKPQMHNLAQMAAQLKQAAQSAGAGDSAGAAQALSELGDQLGGMQESLAEMEALDQVLDDVAACKNGMACKQCEGEGCAACGGGDWKKTFGDPNRFGRDGGKGIGMGRGPGLGEATDPKSKFFDSAVKQQAGQGSAKVVGEADGPNRKGRVQQEIQSEFAEAQQSESDPLSEQRLPHDYRDHAQTYFDALREGTK